MQPTPFARQRLARARCLARQARALWAGGRRQSAQRRWHAAVQAWLAYRQQCPRLATQPGHPVTA